MNKAIYYKYLFIFTGSCNIILVLIFAILAPFENFLNFFGLQKPDTYLWIYSFLLLAGVFGFMYILVGLDITKSHIAVSTGIISQVLYFIILLVFFILGDCNWILFLVGLIELVFAGLFIEFYINFKKLKNESIELAYQFKEK